MKRKQRNQRLAVHKFATLVEMRLEQLNKYNLLPKIMQKIKREKFFATYKKKTRKLKKKEIQKSKDIYQIFSDSDSEVSEDNLSSTELEFYDSNMKFARQQSINVE